MSGCGDEPGGDGRLPYPDPVLASSVHVRVGSTAATKTRKKRKGGATEEESVLTVTILLWECNPPSFPAFPLSSCSRCKLPSTFTSCSTSKACNLSARPQDRHTRGLSCVVLGPLIDACSWAYLLPTSLLRLSTRFRLSPYSQSIADLMV